MDEKRKDAAAEDGATTTKERKLISPAPAGQRDLYLVFKVFIEDWTKELLRSGDISADSSVSKLESFWKFDGKLQGARGGKLTTRKAAVVPTFDWSDKVSDPITQRDNTCAISACIMCIDALHRIAYENINGAGSFAFKVMPSAATKLKASFGRDGAHQDQVLDLIKCNRGLPTVGNITRLTWKEYKVRYMVSAQDTAVMLAQGPVVGGMAYGAGYQDIRGDQVYEGAQVEEKGTVRPYQMGQSQSLPVVRHHQSQSC
ncbi:hypothetical protein ZWY2020_016663 [Hordeum vulgare]|nr:hypothetical protein ZWY2020_016663 [Hordeum vulgare]